uniref:FAD-binding FR-type domain-containing protein n=1 Tax=Globisporangium ultimum (strain ATCC 200006 / CBS 805.95 / DAOM BR144) TaxID=431595 RepID=K3WXN2_GLOUD
MAMVLDLLTSKSDSSQAKNPGSSIAKQKLSRRFAPPAWTEKFWYFGTAAQVLIVVSVITYVFGQLAYYTDYFNIDFKTDATKWWGKCTEMIRPIYFVLFCIILLGATLLLMEFLKLYNVHRITSRYLLKISMFLRRRPRYGCWISPHTYGELLFLAILTIVNCLVFSLTYTRRIESGNANAAKKKVAFEFINYLKTIGTSLGFTTVFNLSFLFLPATRNCAWMEFLNISYANGVKYHRWIGIAFFIKEGEWDKEALPCFDCPLDKSKGKHAWTNVFGEIALLCFLAIGATSYARRKWYSMFYYVHHLFIVAMIFTILHYNGIICCNAYVPVEIKKFTTLGNEIVKVVISRSTHFDRHFKVGQFVYLNVPSVSKLQWHPFTIGSSPRSSATTLTILLKSLGDWTNDLVKYTKECKQSNVLPVVYMDGFHGGSLETYEEYPTVCLIGGGIGVTPILAILDDMVAKMSNNEPMHQRVYFIFTFRELMLLEELHPLLVRVRELDPQEKSFTFHFSLTQAPSEELLAKIVDHKRLSGHHHAVATKYDNETKYLKLPPQPFAQPLQSPLRRSVTYIIIYVFVVIIMSVLTYGGGKIKRGKRAHL